MDIFIQKKIIFKDSLITAEALRLRNGVRRNLKYDVPFSYPISFRLLYFSPVSLHLHPKLP
jgi:hypothetical protein